MLFGEHVLTSASGLAIFCSHETTCLPDQPVSVINDDEILFVIRGFWGLFVEFVQF